MRTLYVLAGPSASGKSEFAIEFAKKHACEILSCDASAFYKYMDKGTAKPSKTQQNEVPHWGINLVEPYISFSIKDYVAYSQKCIQSIFERKHNVLVVGGSGFYLKSFFVPVVDNYTPNKSILQLIESWEMHQGADFLLKKLKQCNPLGLPDSLDIKNLRKVKNALARCLTTGRTLQVLYDQFTHTDYPFKDITKHTMLIVRPFELLKSRIQERTQKMFSSGLIEEVKFLIQNHYLVENTPAALAIGYRETLQFLKQTHQTQQDLQMLKAQIINNTFQLIKKQHTWFRHQMHFDRYLYL